MLLKAGFNFFFLPFPLYPHSFESLRSEFLRVGLDLHF